MILTLQAAGLDDLVIGADSSLCLIDLDLGAPIPREQIRDAPDENGAIDTTELEGRRYITATVQAWPWTWAVGQSFKAFTNQRLRPTLLIEQEGAPLLRAVGRITPFSSFVNVSHYVGKVRTFPVQWVIPSGILESAVEHSATIVPGAGATDGIEFDGVEFDGVEFPLVAPSGVVEVVNAGDRDALPIMRAFGPIGSGSDELAIGNLTTGQELVFEGLVVNAGDYLEVDFRAKTILVNGLASQSRYQLLKFPESSWWSLAPGINRISFLPDSHSGNAQMRIFWRDAYS